MAEEPDVVGETLGGVDGAIGGCWTELLGGGDSWKDDGAAPMQAAAERTTADSEMPRASVRG